MVKCIAADGIIANDLASWLGKHVIFAYRKEGVPRRLANVPEGLGSQN